jgi:methionine synthase II (cobalamin-independent)
MIREVERICAAIPHRDLSIQWDFCHEMLILDGQPQDHFPVAKASMEDIMQRMRRICAAVPADVELGVHLCYGDFGAHHILEPRDMGRMVEVANAMLKAVAHPLQYLHMPVPIARSDEAYFAPLKDLAFSNELFLGVVHAADGVEGTRKRMAAAAKYAPKFGIACECGIARARKAGLVRRLLEIHAAASA